MKQTPPKNVALEDLARLVNDPKRNFEVLLHKSGKWIDWESTALLQGDAKIMAVEPGKDWPLSISFTGNAMDRQQAPYDAQMQFYFRTK